MIQLYRDDFTSQMISWMEQILPLDSGAYLHTYHIWYAVQA